MYFEDLRWKIINHSWSLNAIWVSIIFLHKIKQNAFYHISAAITLRSQKFTFLLVVPTSQIFSKHRISKLHVSKVWMTILVSIAFLSSCNDKHWTHQFTDGTRFPSRRERPIAALSFIPSFPSSVHRCHLDPQSNESTCGKSLSN